MRRQGGTRDAGDTMLLKIPTKELLKIVILTKALLKMPVTPTKAALEILTKALLKILGILTKAVLETLTKALLNIPVMQTKAVITSATSARPVSVALCPW
jgi:hypothetical protein